MPVVNVTTQQELDDALARGDIPRCIGAGHFTVVGSASVEAWGSASVEAWGSASVRAGDSASVRAGGSASVRAGKYCAIIDDGPSTTIEGGGSYLRIPEPTTPAEWCDLHDAAVDDDGIAVLYKAVDEQFRSPHGTSYAPGTMPEAPDWDGGAAECGGGLHLCAHPVDCLQFYAGAPRFVACPVRIDDIAVHQPADMPSKVKVPRIARPCYEVTIDGDPIPPASETDQTTEVEAAAP